MMIKNLNFMVLYHIKIFFRSILLIMMNFYKPDYALDPNSPFARDANNKVN